MGGGKSSSWGGGGGGSAPPLSTADLISQREGKTTEVDQVLSVLRDVNNQYGVQIDTEVGIFPAGSSVMGYHDPNTGNLGMSKSYFDSAKLDGVMDEQAKIGYHPSRGDKSGIEAVMSHEAGHKLNYVASDKAGMSADALANKVVSSASKSLGYKNSANMASKISGYATESMKECIAEAFADVYCNGNNARKESKAVVSELNKYFP